MNIAMPEDVGLSSTRVEHLRTVAQDYIDQGKLAGLITMVARHGKVAHLECYGLGFGVHMGPDRTMDWGTRGTFTWLGHAGTNFWVDPNEALIGLIMPQALHYYEPQGTLRKLTNQAVVD